MYIAATCRTLVIVNLEEPCIHASVSLKIWLFQKNMIPPSYFPPLVLVFHPIAVGSPHRKSCGDIFEFERVCSRSRKMFPPQPRKGGTDMKPDQLHRKTETNGWLGCSVSVIRWIMAHPPHHKTWLQIYFRLYTLYIYEVQDCLQGSVPWKAPRGHLI